MSIPSKLLLRAVWGGRAERAEEIASRTKFMLAHFKSLGEWLAEPFWSTEPRLVSGDLELLSELVLGGYETDETSAEPLWPLGTSFTILQNPFAIGSDRNILINARLGVAKGWQGMSVNSIVITFRFGGDSITRDAKEVMFHGDSLVREVVRIWKPDAVSLDSVELLAGQESDPIEYPTIGYISWLADQVVTGDLSQVNRAHRERVDRGTMLSLDPSSDRLVEEGLLLVDQVFGAGILRPIPAMQGE